MQPTYINPEIKTTMLLDNYKNDAVKRKIVTYYIYNGNSTITDLSKELNLSIPTIAKIVNEMCTNGIINEYGKLETSEGRRPNLYGLNPEAGYFLGVDIKSASLNIGLINFKGDMVELSQNLPYKFENTEQAIDTLCESVCKFMDKLDIEIDKIQNVCVNISGRVNPDTGYSYSVFNFSEIPLTKILEDKIGLPVFIENDSRGMAYGELIQGCVKGEKDVLFINVSWGLGMGIIINRELYKGKSGFAGEFGHIPMFKNEILCHCGKKGCLETEVSGRALYRIVLERLKNGETSILTRNGKDSFTMQDIIRATVHEDLLCIDIVEKMGEKLGTAIAVLINIFNPELVVVGGTLSLTGDFLLQPVQTAVRKYSLNLVNRDTKIVLSKLKDKAGVIGACMMARNHIFE